VIIIENLTSAKESTFELLAENVKQVLFRKSLDETRQDPESKSLRQVFDSKIDMSIFASMNHHHQQQFYHQHPTTASASTISDFLRSDENIIDAILPEANLRHSPSVSDGSFIDPSLDEIPIDGTFSLPIGLPLTGSFSSNGSLSLPIEPVVKQEPCWAPSTPQPPTPTTPTTALGQLGLSDPFGHSFLHQQPQQQHHHQVCTIKTENLESKSLQQMRNASKRRPGPYDNLKDPSGKINLELISDECERNRVKDKRLKNRQAAEKSRKRKKEQTERLESDATRLRIDNEQIVSELARLKQLARKLRAVQSEHEKICEFSQVNHQFRNHQE